MPRRAGRCRWSPTCSPAPTHWNSALAGETYDTAPPNRNRELLVAGLAVFCTVILGAIAS